jgi:hypothetical protein
MKRPDSRPPALSRVVLAVCSCAALAGCDDGSTAPSFEAEVTVMTRNLYLGSALASALVQAPLDQLPVAAAQIWAMVMATNFEERADAIADEIAETRPHLIGIQEASLYRWQSPGDVLAGNPVSAETVVLDHLDVLLSKLEERGLSYDAAVVQALTDVELPIATHDGGLDDVRFTDRDAILVRGDVATSEPRSGLFATNLSIDVGGAFVLNVVRGWSTVDATVDGITFHFWNTHLETEEEGPIIQLGQGEELLIRLQTDERPLVALGDFNSAADGSTTPTHAVLVSGGLEDVWNRVRPGDPGHTCCQGSDLLNQTSLLNRRLDLIFARGDVDVVSAERVGHRQSDRTPSGLWPSDHAGVIATLRLAGS